MYVLWKF